MTERIDNPSSSVPVSKGEEILSMFEALVYGTIRPRDSRIKLVSLIDSALASQEARHQKAIGAAFGFSHSEHCPMTHEQTGAKIECLSCQRVREEARHRQEMEEAHKVNAEAIANQRALSNLEHKTRLELRAAEQREREAGEREKWMYEAVVAHHQAHGCPTVTRVILDAFAAIFAPSPVSAPPTETDEESLVRIKVALGLRPTATLAEIATHAEFAANDIERLHAEKMRLLYPASPVEPVFDPKEPKK